MTKHVLRDAKIYTHDKELTCVMNSIALEYGSQLQEASTFCNKTVARLGGNKTVACGLEGFVKIEDYGAYLHDAVGDDSIQRIWAIAPIGDGAALTPAFFFDAIHSEHNQRGTVGEMHQLSVAAEARNSPLARGVVYENSVQTASGVSLATNNLVLPAGFAPYLGINVLAASGVLPTLDVILETDSVFGFTSPTTVATSSQFTGVGSEMVKGVGPLEQYLRASWTIGGTTPSFTVVITGGVGPVLN